MIAVFHRESGEAPEWLEAKMFARKLRNLAGRLKARLEEALEAALGALLPRPQLRPIPVRVRPQRQPRRD